jgi:DNA polymerase-2
MSAGSNDQTVEGEGLRGFILQPTYTIEDGVPIVELYGVLENGESFLFRDRRQKPAFYVEDAQADQAMALGARLVDEAEPKTSMDGRPLRRVELALPSDAPPLRDRLFGQGIRCYEADVRFAMSYLMERGLRGALRIRTEWTTAAGPSHGGGIDRVFVDGVVEPAFFRPTLRVLSIDIETDPSAEQLLSIALYGAGASEVLMVRPPEWVEPAGGLRDVKVFASERAALMAFCDRVRAIDPDVLTGWNFIDFDLRVLDRLARRRRLRLDIGRGRENLRLRASRGPMGGLEAAVPGRVVVDGIQLLRGAFVRMESYALGFVAREVLGEDKIFSGANRAEQILASWHEDPQLLADYNLRDAKLVKDILDKLQLIELSVERSLLTGLPIDRVAGSIAAFDFLYISELKKRGMVAPSVGQTLDELDDLDKLDAVNLGGYVLEPAPGLWRNVAVCDFKSLYPSLIRTFQIDPLGHMPRPAPGDDALAAPNGATFRRSPPGILPCLLDELFPRRDVAKQAGDSVASHAIKILMNSCYGVLGTPACRFYQPQIAGAITAWGRELLLWSKARIESWGLRVLYGDTDSLFILMGEKDPADAERHGRDMVRRLNADLAAHIDATWNVESKLELQFEKLYGRLLLFSTRGVRSGGRSGARKRYAGLKGDGTVELTGLEAVRSDWTDLAKAVQRELYERLFHDRDVADYLRVTVRALRAGEYDDRLVYRKALRKSLAEYTATTPPHVAAARKSSERPGRQVSYVITVAGAEPATERQHALDHEHYVQKQIRPIAEPVLDVLGLEFDMVIGDAVQLSLF